MNSKEIKDYLKANIELEKDNYDLEFETSMLAQRFLSVIDEIMEEENLSKKELADKVGTSASYITQLFRGSKIPNLRTIAKFQNALGIKYEITKSNNNSDFIFEDLSSFLTQSINKKLYLAYKKPEYFSNSIAPKKDIISNQSYVKDSSEFNLTA